MLEQKIIWSRDEDEKEEEEEEMRIYRFDVTAQ